ncbi:MAG: type II secretion system F family protein [Deltaproteobacteria bacterium]|nr:type II secretion system F family protein [Deltaproteobacteria bacterium]
MPVYRCKIATPEGRIQNRDIESLNPAVLKADLEKQGYFVLGFRRRFFPSLRFLGAAKRPYPAHHLLSFNQEFHVLIRSGLPIVQALEAVIERTEQKRFRAVLEEVKNAIRSGATSSEAFSRFPEFFPALYLASLQAGERTGDLPVTLERYIVYQKKMEGIRQEVKKASFYPLMLLSAALATVVFLVLWVVPRLSLIFIDAKVQLPWATRLLIAAADAMTSWAVVAVPLLLAAVLGLKAFFRTDSGRLALDAQKIRLPVLGELFLGFSLGSFCRTLATTLAGGIPIVQAMQMSAGTLGNRRLERDFAAAAHQIKEGGSLVSAMERCGFFSNLALRLISVGEKTGALPEMLNNVAEYYEMENSRRLERFTSLFEPVLILTVGIFIGGIIIAMYLPIFQLAGTAR